MHIALSGTPGTGKTAVATVLRKHGYRIVRLHELARKNSCIAGVDPKRESELIDIEKLNSVIKKNYLIDDLIIFEGHFTHLLRTMEKVIILRCHPRELTRRLQKKRWSKKKIMENIDAEILDVILCEAVEGHRNSDIFEIDTTKRTIDTVAENVIRIAKHNFQPIKQYRIGQIDWSEEILKKHG